MYGNRPLYLLTDYDTENGNINDIDLMLRHFTHNMATGNV